MHNLNKSRQKTRGRPRAGKTSSGNRKLQLQKLKIFRIKICPDKEAKEKSQKIARNLTPSQDVDKVSCMLLAKCLLSKS